MLLNDLSESSNAISASVRFVSKPVNSPERKKTVDDKMTTSSYREETFSEEKKKDSQKYPWVK